MFSYIIGIDRVVTLQASKSGQTNYYYGVNDIFGLLNIDLFSINNKSICGNINLLNGIIGL